MTGRIELILKTQNLTPTQFADAIGIQRSSMSHILARRNNPSLDFVTKVLNRFPDINSEWLLTGRGAMYKNNALPTEKNTMDEIRDTKEELSEKERHTPLTEERKTLFDDIFFETNEPPHNNTEELSYGKKSDNQAPKEIVREEQTNTARKNTDIERIIIFFKDGHFETYNN